MPQTTDVKAIAASTGATATERFRTQAQVDHRGSGMQGVTILDTPGMLRSLRAGYLGSVPTVAVGELLIQLGLTPVTAALPALSAALSVSPAEGAWVLTAFLLPLASGLLVAGRLGDLLGHRRVFLIGVSVYALATAASGLATSLLPLVLARALQGAGAALISGNNLAIVTATVAPERRGRMLGLIATISALGAVTGVGLGTLVVAFADWQWLFFGVLPLAALAFWGGWGLPARSASMRARDVDWLGAGALVVALTAIAVTLAHPHSSASEAVMPTFHIGTPAVAGLALAAFIAVERRTRRPLINWRPLRSPGFAAPIGVNLILHGTMMGGMFIGPLFVARGLGLNSLAAGAFLLIVQGGTVLTALAGGWLHDRRWSGVRPVAAAVVAAGLLLWAPAGALGNYSALLAGGLFGGLGLGLLLASNNAAIMGSVPEGQRGVASGMLETTRQVGHMLGVVAPVALLALATHTGETAETVRTGFLWSMLAMGLVALLAVALARVPARVT